MNDNIFAVKSLGGNRLGWWLTRWGSPQERDAQQQYFTKATKKIDSFFKAMGKIPILFHHGMVEQVNEPVGQIDSMTIDDQGVFVSGTLDVSNPVYSEIQQMVATKTLFGSSGSLPQIVKISPDGHIDVWPCVEATLTPTPSDRRLSAYPAAAIKSFYGETLDSVISNVTEDHTGSENERNQQNEELALKARLEVELEISELERQVSVLNYQNLLNF